VAKQSIGFIGLGMMGRPMAGLLARAGYRLWVTDADARRSELFAAEFGAHAFEPGAPEFPQLDVVITMLPNSAVVEHVVLGGDGAAGLLRRLAPGTTLIDMSSSEPMRSRALAEKLAAAGVQFLDAPVSGGVKRAVEGSLAIMVGGAPEAFARCEALLRVMGKSVFHVGGPGCGHAVKALNNYVSASGLVAAVDAMHVGRRFGLDPATVIQVLNASSGRNNATENKVAQFMLNGSFDSGFALQLMVKDLRIAAQLADDVGYPMPMGKECLSVWAGVADRLDRVADHTEMYRLLDAEFSPQAGKE
jgi:3-hydroxyisobutyrate dehydrogenase